MIKTDVLIVGGGPAGASCAWQLNQAGLDCLILDKSIFPRQKPCAGWITPAVFKYLQITPDQYPLSLTDFSSFKISLRGIKFGLPTRQYAIHRTEFDTWLLERSGARFIHHNVNRIQQKNRSYIIDDAYQGNYLVGAGGTHCPVKKTFFSKIQPITNGLIIAKEEEFFYPVNDQRCHLWFFENGLPGYAWYVPKKGGYVNVGIGASLQGLKKSGTTLEHHWQIFIHKLEAIGLVNGHNYNPLGYSYYRRQRNQECRRGNVFLTGDALGVATQDMAEGISPAIQSGLLAAAAISTEKNYSIKSIPKFSFPSILGLRK